MQWADVTRRPTKRVLRQFSSGLLVAGVIWTSWLFRTDEAMTARGLAAISGVVGLVGLMAPSAVRLIFQAWMIVAFPVGWLISRLVLALLYFLLFTPVALMFRVMGRDALRRRRPETASYWLTRTEVRDVKRYLQQF